MELLFDIIQNARFPEREIPKEKEVILMKLIPIEIAPPNSFLMNLMRFFLETTP